MEHQKIFYTNLFLLDDFVPQVTSTEKQIVNDIEQMKVDKTIIIISHRDSTLKYCDEIYKINATKLDKIK